MPIVYLVRHAQASFGTEDYDVLSETGQRQAALLEEDLLARGIRPTRVVSGSLRRQLDTARACGRAAPLEPAVDPRWNEYESADVIAHHGVGVASTAAGDAIGAAPGMSSREFQRLLDAALLEWIAAGDESACEESWTAFQRRCVTALRGLAAELSSGEDALVFTSGGAIAAVAANLLRAPAETFVALNRMAVNAGVSKVMVGRSGTHLLSYNEHAHLGREPGVLTFR
jgi:broad specificity phosphatase PhoE